MKTNKIIGYALISLGILIYLIIINKFNPVTSYILFSISLIGFGIVCFNKHIKKYVYGFMAALYVLIPCYSFLIKTYNMMDIIFGTVMFALVIIFLMFTIRIFKS